MTAGKIDLVVGVISYPHIPVTRRMQFTRDDILSLMHSHDEFFYQGIQWTLENGQILPVESTKKGVI